MKNPVLKVCLLLLLLLVVSAVFRASRLLLILFVSRCEDRDEDDDHDHAQASPGVAASGMMVEGMIMASIGNHHGCAREERSFSSASLHDGEKSVA